MTSSNDDSNDITRSHIQLVKDTIIGHYRIIEKIGAGGMGEVYLAEDTELNREVALKFLPPHLCQDADCRARFKREAQAAAKLDHPNIVAVHEVSEFQGRPFFSMQRVEGQSLKEVIAGKPLSLDRIVEIGIQVCEGLQAAHESGVTHRDIKPSNILIDSHGRARIVDFGLASVMGTDQLTKTGSTLGTVGYMSPEQVRGEEADHRSDIFSLGIVLYELITGRQPFKGDNDAATSHAIVYSDPEPLERFASNVPVGLQAIVTKAFAKDRNSRYQHVDDLLVDLKGIYQQSVFQVATKQPSIAVLPFANMSPDLEQEYFCDGMAEEIINALSHLENLRVIARTSAFSFKGRSEDVREIGRKLGVETLLEGSVRKAGSRLRVTAQLIAVKDGSHIWSDRYDREMTDVFAIQDEISLAIVDRLKIKLLGGEKAGLVKNRGHNVKAYNLYLQGRYYWNKRTGEELYKAIGFFEQAIAEDAEFALAYAGLADCFAMLNQVWELSPVEAFPRAKAMAVKALQIDETLAEAHVSLAYATALYDWDWLNGDREYRRAIELYPNYATAHQWYAFFLMLRGESAAAIEEIERARELDPLSLIIKIASAWIYIYIGRIDQAEDQCRHALEMDPDFMFAFDALSAIYQIRREYDKAIEYDLRSWQNAILTGQDRNKLAEVYRDNGWAAYWQQHADLLVKLSAQRYISAMAVASNYANAGDADRAFEWLEKAYLEREFEFLELLCNPSFRELCRDPRFTAYLKKVGIDAF